MFVKYSPLENTESNFMSVQIDTDGMDKIASLRTHVPERLARIADEIEARPNEKLAYLYIRALGAGEVYGPNNNGDFFKRAELIDNHRTFETDAHFFRHHQNKDPQNSIGDVVAAEYNYELDTVDLITRSPIEKIASDLEKMKQGGTLATSMGAKVPFDVCSVCNTQATKRIFYCNHLKYEMLKIYPDGRQVYAINPKPRFIDISAVVIPAEKSSQALRKIAHDILMSKESDIRKRDVGNLGDGVMERGVINPQVIEAANVMDTRLALSSLTDAYGPLRPDEFQAVLRKDASLIRQNQIPYAPFEKTASINLPDPDDDFVNVLKNIDTLPMECAIFVNSDDFMSPNEKRAYLIYRESIPFSRMFLR